MSSPSRKRAPSPGFLADDRGNVFKRYKAGDNTFYYMGNNAIRITAPGCFEFASDAAFTKGPPASTAPPARPKKNTGDRVKEKAKIPRPVNKTRSARHKEKRGNTREYNSKIFSKLPDMPKTLSGDTRIPLWKEETRAFKGTILYHKDAHSEAHRLAKNAQKAPLWVEGRPQFNLFVDGSYREHSEAKQQKRRRKNKKVSRWGPGGYGVIFRNPYHKRGPADLDHDHHNGKAFQHHSGEEEDGLTSRDFNIRYWHSCRVLRSGHAELAAIAQGLDTVVAAVTRHGPPSGASVTIFTDSMSSLERLDPGFRRNIRKDDAKIRDALNLPLLRVIIWQSHYLADHGCEVTLQWLPRNCVLAHALADRVAGWWRCEGTVFNQVDKPVWRRDGILDAVHEDIVEALKKIDPDSAPAESAPGLLESFANSTVQKEMVGAPANEPEEDCRNEETQGY